MFSNWIPPVGRKWEPFAIGTIPVERLPRSRNMVAPSTDASSTNGELYGAKYSFWSNGGPFGTMYCCVDWLIWLMHFNPFSSFFLRSFEWIPSSVSMKCKAFFWLVQVLKNIWRYFFRKRSALGPGPALLLASSSKTPTALTGITINESSSPNSTGSQVI